VPGPPVRKKSYWWVIFPILGGVILLSVLIYVAIASIDSTVYYNSPQTTQNNDGALFRF